MNNELNQPEDPNDDPNEDLVESSAENVDLDNSEPADVISAEKVSPQKLDLSKYRTPELLSRTLDLINVPGAVLSVILFTVGFAILGALAFGLLGIGGIDRVFIIVLVVFGLISGLVSGLFWGIARLVFKTMDNMSEVLRLILETVTHASKDFQDLDTGRAEMPTASELAIASYDQVVLPTVEQAALASFGFLAVPFIWVYKISLNRGVKLMLGQMKRFESKTDTAKSQTKLKSFLQTANKYSDRIEKVVTPVWKFIDSLGKKLRFIVTVPLYAIACGLIGVSMCLAIVIRVIAALV